MGALGDYVHMLYRNYQRYGAQPYGIEGQPLSKAMNNYIKAMDNRINSSSLKVNENSIKELENRLTLNSNQSLKKSQDDWTKKQQQYLDEIYQILFERSQDISGVPSGVQKVYNISQGLHQRTKHGKIINIGGGKHWASSLSLENLKKIKDQGQKKYNQLQELITKINNSQNQSSQDLDLLIKKYQEYTHLTLNVNDHTLGAIEKAIGQKRYNNIATEIGGNFGEMFVATCDDKAFDGAVHSINEFIEQNIKGGQKTAISFEKTLISKNDKGEHRGDKFFKVDPNNNAVYTIAETQDKVDVEIKVNNSDIFASVKSYSGIDQRSTKPHLQDVKLFYTLTFLNNQNDFQNIGNHWLNIHSSHIGIKKGVIKNDQLDNIIKKQVALQALSIGNPFKKNINKANVFIYINRTTGQVYVKTVNDILINQFNNIQGLNKISSIILDNHKSEKIQDRITNILDQLHKQNIRVSLNVKP